MSEALSIEGDAFELTFSTPRLRDGADVYRLVEAAGTLELNSSYAYLLLCDRFSSTCQIAHWRGQLVGVVLAFRVPDEPQTVFVWQVAVHPDVRRTGLGRILLERLLDSEGCRGVRFLEAHVAEENPASEALFHAFARRRNAVVRRGDGYRARDFPGVHATERLIRIGPFG